MLLAFALPVALSVALTGGAGQPRGFDFGDPSPPDLTDTKQVTVYTTGGEILVWPRGPKESPLEYLLAGRSAKHERLRVAHADGTPFDAEVAGEDVWDPTVERSLENPNELILYAGAMKPNVGHSNAEWPQDNWRRRTFAFKKKSGVWIMSAKPLFDDPTDDTEAGSWVGHNYGHAFLKDEKGNTFVFYERVTEERDGLPWTTEIFARRMVSSLKADKKEIPVLRLPRSKAGLAKSWPAAQRAFGGALLEGPRPFKIGAYYFISFSAGDYMSDDYGIHLAWSTSLTGPYEPYLNPEADDLLNFGETLESETQRLTWGAARGSFFEANGKWWVLYHGIDENRPRLGAYIEDGLREVYLAPVTIKPRPNRRDGSPPFEILLGH